MLLGCVSWLCCCLLGCSAEYRDDLDYSYGVVGSWSVEEIPSGELAQFDSVPIDLIADASIRDAIANHQIASGRKVLHIGSGSGLIATLCLLFEADSVLATDVHPVAVSNTRYNVAALVPLGSLDSRLRPASQTDAFSAINNDETFDLVITDLDQNHRADAETSAADQEKFLVSLVDGLAGHLTGGGRAVVIVRQKQTAERLFQQSKKANLKVQSLEKDFEDRDWRTLTEPFTPSVLFEVR